MENNAKQKLMDARAKLMYLAANANNDELQQQCNIAWQTITEITSTYALLKEENQIKVKYYEDKLESMQQSLDSWFEELQKEKMDTVKLTAANAELVADLNEIKSICSQDNDDYKGLCEWIDKIKVILSKHSSI